MSCTVLNFLLVFIIDTNNYEVALKQECWEDESSVKSETVYKIETSFKEIAIISYDHKNKFYYAKLKD